MSSHLGRALMRRPHAIRFYARNASTTSEATNAASKATEKAGSAAGNAASKASQGLSRVTSSAGPALSSAANAANNALGSLGKVGGRTGKVVAFIQSLIPPTVYYSKVGLELAKLIAKNRKMSPPDLATFQSYFQPLVNAAKSPSSLLNSASSAATAANPNTLLSRIRNMDNQQLVNAGVVTAEVIGFFTVGQMIGRFKVVGYRTSGHAHGGEH